MVLKPCLSTTIFGRVPLEQTLKPIADAGFRIIELSRNSSNRGPCKPMVDDMGLSVWSARGTLGLEVMSDSADIVQKELDRELRAMEEVAVYAPCPYIVWGKCVWMAGGHGVCAPLVSVRRGRCYDGIFSTQPISSLPGSVRRLG